MLVRAATAHAFGPFAGERLDLADGLTVVHGPNESGKSTWHAALYLALCGRRRGRGRLGPEHRLVERHRPWDRDEWLVSAEVRLDDGRRVEFRQDLDGRVDCHARDLDVGTDVSDEFMFEGTPDASRWLGLDRHSFAATACIGQAQMLSVLERAEALQEHLQRAAATAGADSTAAAALARLEAFRAEHVGGERATTRPLRRAMAEAQAAREALEAARLAHAEYEIRVVEVDRLREARRRAEQLLRLHEAVAAGVRARDLRARADEAASLRTRLGDVEPPSEAADRAVADRVAAALATWDSLTDAPAPANAPADGPEIADAELWELASILDASGPVDGSAAPSAAPSADPSADRAAAAAERLARAVRARNRRWACLGGVALAALAAAAMIVRGDLVVAGALVAAGTLLAVLGLRRRAVDDPRALRAEVESPRVEAAAARRAAESASARRAEAVARCVRLGLPAEPAALRAHARDRAGGVAVATREVQWREEWRQARERAARQVLDAAVACGRPATTPEDAVDALRRWTAESASRVADADEARRRWARLQHLLDGRPIDELAAEAGAAERRAGEAASGLSEQQLGSVAPVDDETLAELRASAQAAAEDAVRAEAALRERSGTLPSVAEAEERAERADAALAQVRRLDETLVLTRRFLAEAQERAHRDIAPVLAHSVRRALPDVTAGRYTDCIVNPATLRVMVCGPTRRWRDASLLSHGTAEQVYLLLRIALAEALVRPGRVCPLLLDDVTVHADADRSVAMLELLHRASAERQIVLFTQQADVRDWARGRLAGPRDALVELTPVATV